MENLLQLQSKFKASLDHVLKVKAGTQLGGRKSSLGPICSVGEIAGERRCQGKKSNLRLFPLPHSLPRALAGGLSPPRPRPRHPCSFLTCYNFPTYSTTRFQVSDLGIPVFWFYLIALAVLELAMWLKNAEIRPPEGWD